MGEALRSVAEHWIAVWECVPDGPPIVTDDAFLWPVARGGRALMLKVADPAGDEVGAGAVLDALGGRGAVALEQRAGHVILMERVQHEGPTLAAMALAGDDARAMGILVQLALDVQAGLQEAALPDLIPFDRRVQFLGDLAQDAGVPAAHRALLGWAAGLARDLSAARGAARGVDRGGWRPLHGDMHHFNAMHDADRGWLAIDPKGILGPPAYDFANMILNPLPHAGLVMDRGRMARMAGIVAERLDIPVSEMLSWVCLQGCLGLAWSLADDEAPWWDRGARLAGELAGLRLPG